MERNVRKLIEEVAKEVYVRDIQAAEIVGLSVQTLRNYRFHGKGPDYVKRGRSVRYPVSALYEWMESRRVRLNEQE
jgi:predicted DNA-binding transcriptional regulator AlpA